MTEIFRNPPAAIPKISERTRKKRDAKSGLNPGTALTCEEVAEYAAPGPPVIVHREGPAQAKTITKKRKDIALGKGANAPGEHQVGNLVGANGRGYVILSKLAIEIPQGDILSL